VAATGFILMLKQALAFAFAYVKWLAVWAGQNANVEGGRIGGHQKFLSGVMPPAVRAARGLRVSFSL
jgi:hypothetical protein